MEPTPPAFAKPAPTSAGLPVALSLFPVRFPSFILVPLAVDASQKTQLRGHEHLQTHFAMASSGPMSVGSSAMEPPSIPSSASDEPRYAGFTRFELELEVGPPIFPFLLASSHAQPVGAGPRKPCVPESSRVAQTSKQPLLHRLPRLSAVLDAPTIYQIPYLPRTCTQEPPAAPARKV